jgi:release factor glutamine methyltransferase
MKLSFDRSDGVTEATDQPWTIARLLEWTTDFFAKAAADSPRLDAEVLLAEAMKCPRIQLYTQFDQVPPQPVIDQFRQWVKRRAAGEPVAYIVGHREFYSLRFQVNPDVLIPRPETEHVVIAALEAAKTIRDRPLRVLDLGTGSGCIAITLAKYLGDCRIAASDVSVPALEVAKLNADTHLVSDKIRFLQGNLYEALPAGSGAVHLIVSNPPYIGTEEVGTLDQQVRSHEPEIALFAGPKGTSVIERLVADASKHLLPEGYLIFEISPFIADACIELIEASGLTLVSVNKDIGNLRRVVVAKRAL